MRDERGHLLQAMRDRLARATTADGRVDGDVVFAPEADAELRSLLSAVDTATDLEARHAAGWLAVARVSALPGERAGVHRAMAGVLLFPVWTHDAQLVPPVLAAAFDRTAPHERPDPESADGPAEWSAECVASMIAAEGEQFDPPPDAPEGVRRLYELAVRAAAKAPSREALLDTGLAMGILAVAATPEHDPAYEDRCADLRHAFTLAGRHRADGDAPSRNASGTDTGPPAAAPAVQGTEAAIVLAYRALKRMPAGSPGRVHALNDLGLHFHERYQQAHDPDDLDEAIGMARDVIDQLPAGSPHLAGCLSNLVAALSLRLDRWGGEPEEYDEAVDLGRRAALVDPQGTGTCLNLGLALSYRHQRLGRPRDLDEAVGVLTRALRACREPGQRIGVLNTLGNVLRARFLLKGDPADLDEAIRHLSDVPAASGEVTARRVTRLLVPAMTLFTRYELDPVRNGVDLDEALGLLRRAESLAAPGHTARPVVMSDLGWVLRSSYERSGRPDELNEAVHAFRESVALTPEGHEILGLRLVNLAMALDLRHELTRASEDLREARDCRHRATLLPGLGDAHRALLLGATGLSLLAGAERDAAPVDRLDDAITHFGGALDLTPAGSPLVPRRRFNLAGALLVRHDLTRRRRDAKESRRLADAVVAALPPDSPELPGALTLAARARRAGSMAAWSPVVRQELLTLLRRAVESTPRGHPLTAWRLTRLGEALWDRGTDAERAEAADVFRAAALEQQCPPSDRLSAARAWGLSCAERGDHARALEGYEVAVDLLPSVAPRHLVRDDQEFLLGRTAGLGADAAACAVRCGRPGLAVGLLEQARGVMLSHAFDTDSDLTRLREAAPDLATRFEELRDALDVTAGDTRPRGGELLDEAVGRPRVPEAARAELRRRLAAEWQELTGRIRSEHPELGLLRPVREWDERDVRATAARGPVVLVNVSPHGSDALIVTERAIDSVPLPELVPQKVASRRQSLDDALALIETPGTSRKQSLGAQQAVRETLDWLWHGATGPVLDHLGIRSVPAGPWPRLWWSPGGSLRTLPLHAAAPADGTPGTLDRVVSSYTPTLRALHHGRQRVARPADRPADDGVLVVAVPDAAGTPPLPGARREAEHLSRSLPGATLLVGASATRSAVVSALPRHACVHFACHGLGDPRRPSDSLLVLHDHGEHPLTVGDLSRLRLPSVRLAYLSACDTLRTSPELADEAVHMVSALQMAGFPHVIGSLWHVDDTIGADVAGDVYGTLHTGNGSLDVSRTAHALHEAVRSLRAAYPATPSLWACQVHVGP
ncbi:CHAT domain-containing protein [Streptomyces sp. NPDC102473]|uniref:CHAT domain-containing protein n=1 Tax=Streptomyces sp. NPDC102473 TaxID=3366180 RepID=UPI0037FBBBED